MSYRPEGWKNPNYPYNDNGVDNYEWFAYEAGADAMLEALRNKAIIQIIERADEGDTLTFTLPKILKGAFAKGKVVFIPDD